MFGKKSLKFERTRNIDSESNPIIDRIITQEKTSETQQTANDTVTNLVLAAEKNKKVLEVAALIAEEQTGVYVPIPQNSMLEEVFAVRNALLQRYPAQSEGGTVVRFPLFKNIIDDAVLAKERLIERLMLSELDSDGFSDQINDIKIGNLADILNGRSRIEDSINSPNDPKVKKDNSLFIMLGVAALAYGLQKTLSKLLPSYTIDKDLEEVNAEKDATTKAAKTAKILTRAAEAITLFVLIYKLSRRQATSLATQTLPDTVSPELKEDFIKQVQGLYDDPPQELIDLIPEDNQSDQVIIEYCMRYIGVHPELNFEPWVIYAASSLRQMQLQDVIGSIADASTIPESVYTTYIPASNRLQSRTVNTANVTQPRNTTIQVGIDKYLPDMLDGSGGNKASYNILDYIDMNADLTRNSGDTSNFFMSILHNNHYTPELVCCILHFLSKGNLDEVLKFLKDLKALLSTMNGFTFHYGDLLEDILNGLFNNIKSKVLTYAFTQLSRFFEKRRGELLKMGDKIMGNNKYIIFCTPLSDLLDQIMKIFAEFQNILEDLLQELFDDLFDLELKVSPEVLNIAGTNRYRNILDIIDSLIYAIENGKLCNYDGLRSSDIHPDLLPIIDRLSRQPKPEISKAIHSFAESRNSILDQTNSLNVTVNEFRDPEDTRYRGAVSLDREFNNESIIDTIQKYSAQCQEFKESVSNLGIADLND